MPPIFSPLEYFQRPRLIQAWRQEDYSDLPDDIRKFLEHVRQFMIGVLEDPESENEEVANQLIEDFLKLRLVADVPCLHAPRLAAAAGLFALSSVVNDTDADKLTAYAEAVEELGFDFTILERVPSLQ